MGTDDDQFVELDLEKTLNWTGNAVIIQAGSEFRLPLQVPRPSVLAIQFEVEGGYDIDFSLHFKDDHEDASSVLVEPVRVADREGQLDIDTTGVCELLWSNEHAWMSSKVLSYQLQLAPKVNTQMRRFRSAVLSAADDYRVLAAAEAADDVDKNMRTLSQRTAQLAQEVTSAKENAKAAASRHERYLGHVKRLEEEVSHAKAQCETAKMEAATTHARTIEMAQQLFAMQNICSISDNIDVAVHATLSAVDEPLELLLEAYAGSMYPQEDIGRPPEQGGTNLRIDRAEMIHLLQDFEIMSRGPPSDAVCGIFDGVGQSLTSEEFKRCVARAAFVFAPIYCDDLAQEVASNDNKLRWLLRQLPLRIEVTKLPVLDVQRRVRVLAAAEHLHSLLDM